MDVEKIVYLCKRKIEGIDSYSIKLVTFVTKKIMKKKTKDQCIVSEEGSFVSSYPVRENLKKWVDTEFERLVSRGRNTNKFFADTDPDSNTLIIVSDEYILKLNMDEGVIDLLVNGEKNSSIWKDVIENVPVQFASCFDNPMYFTYKISSSASEEMESYFFSLVGFNNDVPIYGLVPLNQLEETVKKFGSMVESMSNIF